MDRQDRITINPRQCGGEPCIRGMRIRVIDVIELLADGIAADEIVQQLPALEAEDVLACVEYAAKHNLG